MIEQQQTDNVVAVEPVAEKPKKVRRKRVPAPIAWLVDMNQLAELTAFSTRTIKRMLAMNEIPGVVRLQGGSVKRAVRFRASEVLRWIEAGCPRQSGRR